MEIPFPEESIVSDMPQEEWEENVVKYNLRLPNENEVNSLPGERPLICVGCGALYQSLEDRMLKSPSLDGCEGCVNKAKWG